MKTALLLSLIVIFAISPSETFAKSFFEQVADPIVTPVTKATKWVGKQSGITPTVDNANNATKSAEQLANEARQTIVEIKPKADDAFVSVKNTSDAAGEILRWVKWPVVIGAYSCALWLLGVAVRSWLPRSQNVESPSVIRAPNTYAYTGQDAIGPLPPRRRFLFIAIGSILFFTLMSALLLLAGISFQNIIPLLIVTAVVSSLAASALFWIPIRRMKVCVALGFVASIAILMTAAFALP
jgi:hypothetical protein